jgi:hypothetical protein
LTKHSMNIGQNFMKILDQGMEFDQFSSVHDKEETLESMLLRSETQKFRFFKCPVRGDEPYN